MNRIYFQLLLITASLLIIPACTTSSVNTKDCPQGTQKLENCPPPEAIEDAEIAELYLDRSYERPDLEDFDPVSFARNVDIPVNQALAKFIDSTDEGALNGIATKLWMIENAEHTLDVMYYIFRDDLVGQALLGALCDAVQRGVDIRIMLDSLGSISFRNNNLKALQSCAINAGFMLNAEGQTTIYKARVQTVIFNAVSNIFIKPNRRSHDKLIVKDGRFPQKSYAITGGRNISLDYYAFLEDGSENPHSYRDAEILVKGFPDAIAENEEWGIGDVSTTYYTLVFLFKNNKKLKMSVWGDPLSNYENRRETFQKSLITVKTLPRVQRRLAAMDEYMSEDFHESYILLAHELANITNSNVVKKAVENLEQSANSIMNTLSLIPENDIKHISIVSPYLFAARYKDKDGNVVVDEAQELRDWLDQHPDSIIEIVTNSVLTSGNPSTQAVIDFDLAPRLLMDEEMQKQWGSKLENSELNPELVESEAWIEMANNPRLRIYETGKLDDELFGGNYHHSKLHAKYIVSDDSGFVGTSNFDYRSRLYNNEMGYFFESKDLADDLRKNTEYLISLSYRWGSPEWLEMRRQILEFGGGKGKAIRNQRRTYNIIGKTGLMWLF